MLRWSYILPRLILLAVACTFIVWMAPWLVHRTIVVTGQSLTASRWEIGDVATSLWNPRVELEHLQVTAPRSPMRNLLEAERVRVRLDRRALFHGRYVIDEGSMSGVRWTTERATSGRLDPNQDFLPEWAAQRVGDSLTPWFDQLCPLLLESLEEQVESFESVHLAREMESRWPTEYRQMEARIEQLQSQITRLRELAQQRPKNVPEQMALARQILTEVEALQRELDAIPRELDRLSYQAQRDKEALLAARDRDLERINEITDPTNFTSERLAEYLLGPRLCQPVGVFVRWMASSSGKNAARGFEPQRLRGVDVLFPIPEDTPLFLARRLAVDGSLELDEFAIPFSGTVEDLSSDPQLHGKPTRVVLEIDPAALPWFADARVAEHTKTARTHEADSAGTAVATIQNGPITPEVAGSRPATVAITLDQTNETPRTVVEIDVPALAVPEQEWGDCQQFALVVSNARWKLQVKLELVGDRLDGRIDLAQSGGAITPILPGLEGQPDLSQRLTDAVRSVHSICAAVTVSGNVKSPQFRLHSDLGNQVALAMESALREEWAIRQQELAERLQQQLTRRMQSVEPVLRAQSEELLAECRATYQQLEALARQAGSPIPERDHVVGEIRNALGANVRGILGSTPSYLPSHLGPNPNTGNADLQPHNPSWQPRTPSPDALGVRPSAEPQPTIR